MVLGEAAFTDDCKFRMRKSRGARHMQAKKGTEDRPEWNGSAAFIQSLLQVFLAFLFSDSKFMGIGRVFFNMFDFDPEIVKVRCL